MANLLHTILKYTVLVLSLINLVIVAWYLLDGVINKRLGGEDIAYQVVMIVIFLVGCYAAHTEDFLYLVVFGVVIVVGLVVGFLIKFHTLGEGAMIVLAILVFIFALFVKRGSLN